MYDVNFTEIVQNGITVANTSWPIQFCKNGYEYDFTDVPYETIATQVTLINTNFFDQKINKFFKVKLGL